MIWFLDFLLPLKLRLQFSCTQDFFFSLSYPICIYTTPLHITVAANVVSKETHDIAGRNFSVRLHRPREYAAILVSTPPGVDLELLQRRIEKKISPAFSMEPHSCDSYLVKIAEQLSGEGTELKICF